MTTLNYEELSYNKTELKQFGEYVAPNRTSLGSELRAMRGSTAVRMATRIFSLSIRRFTATTGSLGLV
jgi:hypothetical protein